MTRNRQTAATSLRVAGVYPVIVSCVNGPATGGRKPAKMSADAVLVVVRVEPDNKEGS